MSNIQLGIYNLTYNQLRDTSYLVDVIYPNMQKNYYWSDDFSAKYYIAQARAGFIAVTDRYEDEELLLPEIQFAYAILDFKDLHISRKVQKLLKSKNLQLEINYDFDQVVEKINTSHKNCWLTPRYLNMLKDTKGLDDGFELIAVTIKDKNEIVAAELGYIIGKTYTSLSGYSSKEKRYANYGTAQLVLLAQYLEKAGFHFWNLGQPYMDYKLKLGAKIYERNVFLKRWYSSIQ
ncbi:Leucyl/phenylalanyl-tRNA--protein transferase [hydrothermal vent metagenome]|uniref:Leucyl/phenylalanyl-tRNA--protein transferase n=1 Tax=hydrothermal vent metagenome TaxID=652676 RepID=A0A1W1ECL3_9ZZZZ